MESKDQNQIIKKTSLKQEVESSYLDYAMSVIISRALPDVRDGLKPVHRRILYAMHEMGLTHKAKYKKSANVIGVVLGKYHPHGDQAVYDALCRMTQDFSLRYPLIDGQGNFGSLEDSPAAYRYTEARLAPIAAEMLADLEKNVVPFRPNYDGTTKEPEVLPAKIPNLLINGAIGIAVGMATNIPTHNLKEVCQALCYLLDNPKAEVEDLMQFIKGPDFPTGGIIYNKKAIKQAYLTGKGPLTVRGKAEIIEEKNGHYQISITELPWQVSKADLLVKIAELVRDKKLQGIKNIRDESARGQMKIILELKKGISGKKVLNKLFKLTSLQEKFYFNMVALEEGIEPKLFNLKEILEEFLKHREKVLYKRYEFDLKQTEQRLHILEGFLKAIAHIDEVIRIIRNSASYKAAELTLKKKFNLSSQQAQAILEMKLRQLVKLERENILKEYEEKKKLKEKIEKILSDPKEIKKVIKQELKEIEEKYGDERRTTVIEQPEKEIKEEELIIESPTLIIGTRSGYIKRISPETFRHQNRGGKGVIGLTVKQEDEVAHLVFANTTDSLLCFTDKGKAYQMRVFDIPEAGRTLRGKPLVNFLEIDPKEKVLAILAINKKQSSQGSLVMATTRGNVKKILLKEFETTRSTGKIAFKLKNNEQLKSVKRIYKDDLIILTSSRGRTICFSEKDLRLMGRNSGGIRGMKLQQQEELVGLDVVRKQEFKKSYLLLISENGFGKMTSLSKFALQKRGGKGLISFKISQKTGNVAGAMLIPPFIPEFVKGDILIVSSLGQVLRIKLASVPKMNRATMGVRLIRLNDSDKVASFTLV